MERSLRTLLAGVIDYAGLFPPAKLAMEPAVEEFLAIRASGHNWLVSRFACPAAHLPELAQELEKHDLAEPVPISVIGTGGKDKHHWDTAFRQDIAAAAKFREIIGRRARIEAYEVRLPDNHHTEAVIQAVGEFGAEETFLEIPWSEGMEESIACVAESELAFAKARTGGADASAFPSDAELAAFIQQCVQLDTPFKLTAGLHEPLPHEDHHGFVNVLATTVLALAHDLSRREMAEILDTADPKPFAFGPDRMQWNDLHASIADIEAGRELFRSFGSCSVEEPLTGLARAGYTPTLTRAK